MNPAFRKRKRQKKDTEKSDLNLNNNLDERKTIFSESVLKPSSGVFIPTKHISDDRWTFVKLMSQKNDLRPSDGGLTHNLLINGERLKSLSYRESDSKLKCKFDMCAAVLPIQRPLFNIISPLNYTRVNCVRLPQPDTSQNRDSLPMMIDFGCTGLAGSPTIAEPDAYFEYSSPRHFTASAFNVNVLLGRILGLVPGLMVK